MLQSIARALVLVALVSLAASAQHAQTREGFSISFGIGGGSAGVSCDGCGTDRENGLSGYLRLGGYVRPTLLVAGETNGFTKNVDGVDVVASFVSAVVQWYPQVASGFYLKGGAGIATGSLDDGVDELAATGMGITLGTGYEWRVTRNFSLTPYVNYLRSVGAEAKFNGVGLGGNLNVDVFQFGLGFTWH